MIDLLTPSVYQANIDKHQMRILGVIPARYQSSRFEGKPLQLINNVPMLKRTYLQAKQSKLLTDLIVATDDSRIKEYCNSENIPVIMTSKTCLTGTDRVAEVSESMHYDFYINIQGDEPILDPQSIDDIVEDFLLHRDKYIVYNLYKKFDDESEIASNTVIKTIVNEQDEMLYLSRLPIPFNKSDISPIFKKHICVYGFTKKSLDIFSDRPKTLNEQHEDIEMLRFVDLGYKVKMKKTFASSIAVDVPEDIEKVERYLNTHNLA